jgi:hypothetical protein
VPSVVAESEASGIPAKVSGDLLLRNGDRGESEATSDELGVRKDEDHDET